jgi:hypothetical protein
MFVKLEELCCRWGIRGSVRAVRPREDEHVALGIDGDAWHFAEIHSGRKLEKIRDRIEL